MFCDRCYHIDRDSARPATQTACVLQNKMASLTAAVQPRLVLHFDVNETIMVADPAGGDSFEDVLNKMLAKRRSCDERTAAPWTTRRLRI